MVLLGHNILAHGHLGEQKLGDCIAVWSTREWMILAHCAIVGLSPLREVLGSIRG